MGGHDASPPDERRLDLPAVDETSVPEDDLPIDPVAFEEGESDEDKDAWTTTGPWSGEGFGQMTELRWSEWVPFAEALAVAPRLPGVYMAREGAEGPVVYIGMAGERRGGGKPQGIRGRLSIYASGKGLASGLGEAVFDRALADLAWLQERVRELETTGPQRAKQWGIEAFARADLHLRWTITVDRASAAELETELVRAAGDSLWNKASARLIAVTPLGVPPSSTGRIFSPAVFVGAPTTQPVTEADLAAGRIRVPIAHKSWFPTEHQQVSILLRGETVICSWNPRSDPKPRSGVLRPPIDVLRRLVQSGERLTIVAGGSCVALE